MGRDYWGDGYGPRRAAKGIRAQTQRGQFGKTWWAAKWLQALEQLVDAGRLSRGRSYARSGQVTQLDAGTNGVDALVQGSMPAPYRVTITFKRLSEAEWEQVFAAMASEAIYAAKLINGVMPEEIENAFAAAGVTLFPASEADLTTSCSCPDWSNPCKHTAAVFYLLGERFDADPFLMFLLRGRSGDETTTALRALRGGSPDADTSDEPMTEPETPLFDAKNGSAVAFWGTPERGGAPPLNFREPSIAALAVKSLGAPAFWSAEAEFTEIMEQHYRAIGAHARALAFPATVAEVPDPVE